MTNAGSHKLIALPAVLDVAMTLAAVASPPAHVQEPGSPGSLTAQATRGSTVASLCGSICLLGTQLLAGRQKPCSQLHQRRPGQIERQLYVLKSPSPLVDASGQALGVVNNIVDHEYLHREETLMAQEERAVPSACKYRL